MTGRTFGTSATGPSGLNITNVEERLMEVHWRLARVTIEHLDACECVLRYDRPTTVFYIDPPYYKVKGGYAHELKVEDFPRIRAALDVLKGKFILSLNDHADVRAIFKGFVQERVTLKYSSGNCRAATDTRSKDRHELLIHNIR